MGFCRNYYIKYSSQFRFILLSDNVHLHLNRILAFAFVRYLWEVLWVLKVQQLPNPAKSNPTTHVMALDNRSLRKSYDLGRVACFTKITYDENRHYKPISRSEAKKKTFKSTVTKLFYKYFRCHTFRKTRFNVYWALQYLCSNWKFKSHQMELSLVLQTYPFNIIEHPLCA